MNSKVLDIAASFVIFVLILAPLFTLALHGFVWFLSWEILEFSWVMLRVFMSAMFAMWIWFSVDLLRGKV